MNGFSFVPDDGSGAIDVPYLEDARADFAPYWGEMRKKPTEKKLRDAQLEVSQEMAKLGGMPLRFTEGVFVHGDVRRPGIEIRFAYGTAQGVLRVAGLPMRSEETRIKLLGAKIQAIKIVRDWLKAAVTAQVFSPGNDPLLGHLLLPDGSGRTVTDYIRDQGNLPDFGQPSMPMLPG